MLSYIKGRIAEISEGRIVIECGGLGFEALVSDTQAFGLGQEGVFYCYEIVSEDSHDLAAFPDREYRDAFYSLIKVKGIGPRTALGALGGTTPKALYDAIKSNNTSYLKKLPGIGAKAASQIILDLKGSLTFGAEKGNPHQYEEVREGLKVLKFKVKDIDEVLASISMPGASNEDILREALKLLRRKKA